MGDSVKHWPQRLRRKALEHVSQGRIGHAPGEPENASCCHRQLVGDRLDVLQAPTARHHAEQQAREKLRNLPASTAWVPRVVDLVELCFGQTMPEHADDSSLVSGTLCHAHLHPIRRTTRGEHSKNWLGAAAHDAEPAALSG
jgi:hypothetical protein